MVVAGPQQRGVDSTLASLVLPTGRSCPSSMCPLVVFEAVDAPVIGPLHFSHITDYVYHFCAFSDPDVGHSVLVGPMFGI